MKLIFSKSPIVVVAVIVALAAGTALVAGYVDGPGQGAAVTAEDRCAECPKAGTDACGKVSGVCEEGKECATPCGEGTCEEKAAACPMKAEASGCPAMAEPACGTGGCPFSQ
jgi:hypothetical protein